MQLLSRYLRLTIPMTVNLVATCAFMNAFILPVAGISAGDYTYSQALRQGLWHVYETAQSSINPVVWTMRIELIGSVAIYFIYKIIPVRFKIPCLLALVAIAVLDPLYLGFPLGALLREAWVNRIRLTPLAAAAALLLGLGLGFGSLKYFFHGYSIGAGYIIFATVSTKFLQKIFSTAIPLFLGRISFSLYLYHAPIIVFLWLYLSGNRTEHCSFTFFLWCDISLSILCACLMTAIADKPVTQAIHLMNRFRKQPPEGVIKNISNES